MPRLFPKTSSSTPEQEQQALAETERELALVIGLMRRLDLPMTAFETVTAYYGHNLSGLLLVADEKKSQARYSKIAEIEASMAPSVETDAQGRITGVRKRVSLSALGGHSRPRLDDDDMQRLERMTDDELDVELARIRKG